VGIKDELCEMFRDIRSNTFWDVGDDLIENISRLNEIRQLKEPKTDIVSCDQVVRYSMSFPV